MFGSWVLIERNVGDAWRLMEREARFSNAVFMEFSENFKFLMQILMLFLKENLYKTILRALNRKDTKFTNKNQTARRHFCQIFHIHKQTLKYITQSILNFDTSEITKVKYIWLDWFFSSGICQTSWYLSYQLNNKFKNTFQRAK